MTLYFPFPRHHNKDNNIQYQFLPLCRLQQLVMPSRLSVVLVSILMATPALIFWLWLVIQPTTETIQCPERYWYDPGNTASLVQVNH